MRAVFVTTNENKLREVERILGVELGKVGPDVPEVQSLDFAEVAAHKASAARAGLGSPPYPVLVEDSGLVIGAWNGLPGAGGGGGVGVGSHLRPAQEPSHVRPDG